MKRNRMAAIVFLALALAANCAANAENSLVTAEETQSQTFPAGVSRIEVDVFNGVIAAATWGNKTVQAEITKIGSGSNPAEARADIKNIEVKITRAGNVLRIVGRRSDGKIKGNCGAAARLRVPAGVALDLKTSNEPITVEGPVGDVKAVTANGEITADGAKGTLDLATSNEPIKVKGGSGRLTLETSNDSIEIVSDNVLVSAATANGKIDYAGKLAPGSHEFSTSSEEITLALAGNPNFRVDAETSNGSIDTDFDIERTDDGSDETVLRGTAGARPGISLTLRSSNSDIHIKKR